MGEETNDESSRGKITISGSANEDQPATLAQDTLGFRPYVQAVYSFLLHPATKAPFTLSVEGDWGSGKSSFMQQLQQCLEESGHSTMSFNAWRHDKMESMWAAFALHFVKTLSARLPWCERIHAHWLLRWKRFDGLKGWFPLAKAAALILLYAWLLIYFFGHLDALASVGFVKDDKANLGGLLPLLGGAGAVAGFLFFLSKLADTLGNPLKTDLHQYMNTPDYAGKASFIEDFHRDFGYTVDVLAKGEKKLFVFIDDLDRAEIPKAAELMQGLNMMIAGSPRLVFIIGMDREKVAAGLALKYKELLPYLYPTSQEGTAIEKLVQAQNFGYNFLEKFVQLSFRIPRPSATFTKRFVDSLSGATNVAPTNDTRVAYDPFMEVGDGADAVEFREITLRLAPFFSDNPRKIKQFVNIFRLQAHIAHSTGQFKKYPEQPSRELTLSRLGKFIALIMLYPDIVGQLIFWPQFFKFTAERTPPEDQSEWQKNGQFMRLLQLRPDNGRADDYNITQLDLSGLLRTAPLLKAEPGDSAGNAASGSTPNYPADAMSDEDYDSVKNAAPPISGSTTTTTTAYPFTETPGHDESESAE